MTLLRLSERLTYTVSPHLTVGQTADSLNRKSIIDHLTQLLNTRQGSAPIDPDYGLSDLSNIAGSFAYGTTESICVEVANQIDRYEPRLKEIRISINNSAEEKQVLTLRFDITGKIADAQGKAGSEVLSLLMRIDSSGRIRLQARQD